MKNRRLVSWILVLVLVSISCNLFAPTSPRDSVVTAGINQVFDALPAYDPLAPLPSSSAAALRGLMELDPSVAVLEGDVQGAERAALTALLAELQIQLGTGSGSEVAYLPPQLGSMKVAIPARVNSFPIRYNLTGALQSSENFSFDAMFVAILISLVSDSLAVGPAASIDKYSLGAEGGSSANNGLSFKKNPDGSTSLEIVNKTDATKDGASATADGKVNLDGWRCPNEAGQVSFTIKELFGAESGGASYTVELSAMVRAEVNEAAELSSMTIDVTQSTRKVKGSTNVYVESGVTYKAGEPLSNQRVIRSSQQATAEDISSLTAAGQQAAYNMALGSLFFAKDNWYKGGCTKIEAASPGTVQTGSNTAIPVTVRHRLDGSEVPSKLEAVLTGEQSVAPTTLAKTPGTLTYTAPGENGKSATLSLTATSRRGRSTLELTVNTGGKSYSISGGADDFHGTGTICDISQPWTVSGSGVTVTFNPTSANGGSYTYSGSMSGFALSGSGEYTVIYQGDTAVSIQAGGEGSAGGSSAYGEEIYALTPLSEGSCP